MPVPETKTLSSCGNAVQVASVHRDIDVASKPGGIGIARADLKKKCHYPDHAILNPGFHQRNVHALKELKQLVHMYIQGSRCDHLLLL